MREINLLFWLSLIKLNLLIGFVYVPQIKLEDCVIEKMFLIINVFNNLLLLLCFDLLHIFVVWRVGEDNGYVFI